MDSLTIANAAGICKTVPDVRRFSHLTLSSYVTVGSISLPMLFGNPEPRTYSCDDGAFFNSIGLQNEGASFYTRALKEMLLIVTAAHKKLRVSIVGDHPEQYGALAQIVAPLTHTIEINAGCPNVWKNGEQKKIPSFDLRILEEIVTRVGREVANHGPVPDIALKLSPYSDPGMIAEVAALVRVLPVSSLVLCNTFPNALPLKSDGTRAISGKGYAGMSGHPYKPIVLGQVAQFREHLPDMRITAVGGIREWTDIRDYVSVGANDFQVGEACYRLGENVVQQIAQDAYLNM
ncbi:MAG TPA: dihydroorotate dehydrogenase [Candidatus Paceibacterota bacterium]|nr:dihydroorotate dehydrogenase [Candidatus Paceibacterota bacterium]